MRESRKPAPLLVLLLFSAAVLTSACSKPSEASEKVGAVGRIEGSVSLVRDGSTREAVADEDLLAGDRLRIDGTGNATFRLGRNAEFELAQGTAELRGARAIRLSGATLLVSSSRQVEMDLGTLKLSFDRGAVRVELPAPGRVSAYEVENLKITSVDQEVPLPQLWQVSVTAAGVLDQARPLQFSRDDAMDAEHLAHALDVDGKLGNLLRGIEPQLAATDGSALNQRLGSAGIIPESLARFTPATRSDQLMGLAFAREWKKDAPSELAKGFEQALALKVLGASWGLIAQNFQVNADALVAALQAEIDAVLFPSGAGQVGTFVPAPIIRPAPRPVATSAPPRAPAQPPAPPAPPAAPPVPGSSSPTPSGLVGPVLDPLRPLLPQELEAIIDELYGLVHGLVPLV